VTRSTATEPKTTIIGRLPSSRPATTGGIVQ
jgi:hypothetical protein